MEQEKLERINALAKKAKSPEGLTPQETKERDALRREYIEAYRNSLTAHLNNTYIQYPDGTRKKLQKKESGPDRANAGPISSSTDCPD